MPGYQRDPLSVHYDAWARELLARLAADPWNWHGSDVLSLPGGPVDTGGLSREERAAQRSLYYCTRHTGHGMRMRPVWSLQVAWSAPRERLDDWRRRLITARVTPRDSGRRAVLIRAPASYVANPTSRGALPGEDWRPRP